MAFSLSGSCLALLFLPISTYLTKTRVVRLMANANPYSNFSTVLYMSYQFSKLPMKSGKSIYKGEFFACFLMIYVHISTYKHVSKSLHSFTKYETMERIKTRDLNHPINV